MAFTGPIGDQSPLGELAAQASDDGYKIGSGPKPYHGYYFRILTQQGPNAPGGTLDYVVKNKMIGGFALLAYPAEYGNSGVMTFLVNHSGTVYQKDLGYRTATLARRMTVVQSRPDLEKGRRTEIVMLRRAARWPGVQRARRLMPRGRSGPVRTDWHASAIAATC